MKTNPDYLNQLESLPDELRKAWLYGEWDAFAGQFFKEYDKKLHVCAPFEIPKNYVRYLAIDYGLDMLAALWVAVSPQNEAFVYREVYKSGLVVSDAAAMIKAAESEDEEITVRIAPPDLWGRSKDSGKSVIEIFASHGLAFLRADNNRRQGWMALREWLKPYTSQSGETTSRLHIFENCSNLLRTLPLLQYDKRDGCDAANEPHELTHAPDALRYFASWRTFADEAYETAQANENEYFKSFF